TAVIQQVKQGRGHRSPWLVALLKRKPAKLAAGALANKIARIAWKLMMTGGGYDGARVLGASAAAGRGVRPTARRPGGGARGRDGRIDRSKVRDNPQDPLAERGRGYVWSSRRGNHLGQQSKATASTGRTYGCKRSDQTSNASCATGAVHIWILVREDDTE